MFVLEIDFVGQCGVFVLILYWLFFFPLAEKLIGPRMGHQFFKNVDFSVTYPLNLDLVLMTFVMSCDAERAKKKST